MKDIKLLIAQINPTVGNISSNAKKIIDIIQYYQEKCNVIIFPEFALSGFFLKNLLFNSMFYKEIDISINIIRKKIRNCYVILGYPTYNNNKYFSTISVFYSGLHIATYNKQYLIDYKYLINKKYYINNLDSICTISIYKHTFGICVYEDIKIKKIVEKFILEKTDFLLCFGSSYFEMFKKDNIEHIIKKHSKLGLHIIYVNQVGGQYELVFNGQSVSYNNQGYICSRSYAFKEHLQTIILNKNTIIGNIEPNFNKYELLYRALVCGTRDYIKKNKFPGIILGLSGGIDSALTLAIATDAIGPEKIHVVMMPSIFTTKSSIEDSKKQLKLLCIKNSTIIYINSLFKNFISTLSKSYGDIYKKDILVQENIQSRIRCILLMAISNKTGKLVLTTSNKSEISVGYTTLYGDMAGGFAILKDIFKTQIYILSKYRNSISYVIPNRILYKEPSSELSHGKIDKDDLPNYSSLDKIIYLYTEKNKSIKDIINMGFSKYDTNRTISLINKNKHKRRQLPLGIIINTKTFLIE